MKLHHVGIVIANIERQARRCAEQFGLSAVSDVFHDPIQKAHVQFWANEEQMNFEFIQPAADDSPVRGALASGGGLVHLCFEVSDIHEAVSYAERGGAIVVCPPVPAVAFQNRPIAFLFFRGMGLVEFVEEPRS